MFFLAWFRFEQCKIRVIVTRYGGVWPGAVYWFLVLSVEVFDLFISGLFLIGVVLSAQSTAVSIGLLESQFNES